MTNTVTIGKRLLTLESIALVEPFDPSGHPGMKTTKAFKARVVLVDRQSVLTEDTPAAFATAHGFRMLEGDGVGINPAVKFGVENFVPQEGFSPTKPYQTRLSWRDQAGDTQSKLLLSAPDAVLAVAVTAKEEPRAAATAPKPAVAERKPAARTGRHRRRQQAVEPEPA